MKLQILKGALMGVLMISVVGISENGKAFAQRAKRSQAGTICGDPTISCKTTVTFDANDIPFRVPRAGVIWESEQFYAIILSSISDKHRNCEAFIPETDRMTAQGLFPRSKVFTSRCEMGGGLFYTNITPDTLFMAVYAGKTKAQANKMLATVKATGRYSGANVRRMKTGFNGT